MFSPLTSVFMAFDAGSGLDQVLTPDLKAKFLNIFLFLAIAVYFLRKPIAKALNSRREGIRRDLMRAREERDAAVSKLSEVEARLSKLDAEVEAVRTQAQREAAEERARIEAQTEEDARKLGEQARREMESAAKAARAELRAFVAQESVALAEESIRRELRPEDDSRLVNQYVEELGGVRR
jgi:ATP synthase F0 subunit b